MDSAFMTTIVFVIAAAGAVALQQQITFYDLPDQQGNSVTFTGKHSDLSNWTFFLNITESYCFTGWFAFFDKENFTNESNFFYPGLVTAEFCRNFTERNSSYNFQFKSGRSIGPSDLYAPALSLIEGSNTTQWGGREIVITAPALTNFQFVPNAVASFGNSSWTLFTGINFEGSSTCFNGSDIGGGIYLNYPNSSFPVQSVIKGCDAFDIEHYKSMHERMI